MQLKPLIHMYSISDTIYTADTAYTSDIADTAKEADI